MAPAVLMTPTQRELPSPEGRPSRRAHVAAVAVSVLLGVGLGIVGTVLVTPGGSLVRPTAVVLGAGGVVVTSAWVLACFASSTRWLWTFAVVLAACTVSAAAWTFFVALPASVLLDPGATSKAQAALAWAGAHQDVHGDLTRAACTDDGAGHVGPLDAPYHECTIWTPLAHVVLFDARGPGRRGGLAYIASARAEVTTLPDECVRHLVGSWWMYAPPPDAGGDPGQCPFGYRFEGGG